MKWKWPFTTGLYKIIPHYIYKYADLLMYMYILMGLHTMVNPQTGPWARPVKPECLFYCAVPKTLQVIPCWKGWSQLQEATERFTIWLRPMLGCHFLMNINYNSRLSTNILSTITCRELQLNFIDLKQIGIDTRCPHCVLTFSLNPWS